METKDTTVTKHLLIKGLVQGVGFRYFLAKHAELLTLTGYAKNINSNTVTVHVAGESAELDIFISLCQKGPAGSAVKSVTEEMKTCTKIFSHFRTL